MRARGPASWFAQNVLVPLSIAVILLLALEGGCRVAGRLRSGSWPHTRSESYAAFVRAIEGGYRLHPYLVVCGNPGATIRVPGHEVHFNSLGMRGPDVRVPKPAGTFRVVCEGGSTTFDLLAATDGEAWPARVQALLGPGNDVVNAGFQGWSSLESLISLEVRDVDLAPDLVVVLSGMNDLQPAGHVPFAADYSLGHADILPRVLGLTKVPLRLASRSLFVETLRDRLRKGGEQGEPEGHTPAWNWSGGARANDLSAEAVAVFERNLRSTAAVARAHGARTLLLPMTVRIRKGREEQDRSYLVSWTPGLTPDGYLSGLARFNAVARKLGEEGTALFFDPYASEAFGDDDFGDPAHFSAAGSAKFARAVAAEVARIRSAERRP